MKKKWLLSLAALGASTMTQAVGIYSSELGVNPYMTGEDYTGWATGDPWRPNGAGENLVFDLTVDGPAGFFAAEQALVDLTAVGPHIDDPDYNANTARLVGLSFNDLFFGEVNVIAAGVDLEANFFFEFDITTSDGTYRAKSQEFSQPWTTPDGQVLRMTWLSDEFLGNPFRGAGLALSGIESMKASNFMHVVANNSTGTDTVFFTLDNCSIEYEVSVQDEISWAGYPVHIDGYNVNTGDFLGWVNITFAPWIYCYSLGSFAYLPESNVQPTASWIYLITN